MSATVETNTASWRKRLREDDTTTQMDLKKPRYYYRLESESSKASEEDTESVCSLQDKETDVVRDTTDTDSKSGCSDDEYEVHYEEYEVASLSGSENGFCHSNSSSDSEDMMLAAAAVAICDSSLETWVTDCEDSDNSSLDESSFGKTDFSTCIQCKSVNDNPLYRYCEKCFQDRKKFYPPRPKRNRKSRNTKKKKKNKDPPVKLDTLRSCLKDLSQDSGIGSSQSQDSGIGSSQEWPVLDLAQIVVPEKHLTSGTSQISTVSELSEKEVEDDIAKGSSDDVEKGSLDNVEKGSLDNVEKGSLVDVETGSLDNVEKGSLDNVEMGSSDNIEKGSSGDVRVSTITEPKGKVGDVIEKLSSGEGKSLSLEAVARENDKVVQEIKTSESSSCNFSGVDTNCNIKRGRKRHLSESSISDFDSKPTRSKIPKIIRSELSLSQGSDLGSEISSSSFISSIGADSEILKSGVSENSELCIFCNDAPKDAIFLHAKVAHQCCCYKCAKRTIKTIKRCPICNVTVNKVFRVIKS